MQIRSILPKNNLKIYCESHLSQIWRRIVFATNINNDNFATIILMENDNFATNMKNDIFCYKYE